MAVAPPNVSIIYSDATPPQTVFSPSIARVFGTIAANTVTLAPGGRAILSSFNNTGDVINIQGVSSSFEVSRSGSTLTLRTGGVEVLDVPAGTTPATINFNDGPITFAIVGGNIVLSGNNNTQPVQETFTALSSNLFPSGVTLPGTAASELIQGTNFADSLSGAGGNDTIRGEGGNDTIDGGADNDSLLGGDGNDLFIYTFNSGSDTIDGGTGNDTLTLSGSEADDVFVGNTPGNIDLNGNRVVTSTNLEDFVFNGLGGNDSFDIGNLAGAITLNGGGGNDLADFTNSQLAVTANLTSLQGTRQVPIGFTSVVTFVSIENLTGGIDNDFLIGNAQSNVLSGGPGMDTLLGADGNDSLSGGPGNDSLDGGNGIDTLLGGDGNDTIVGDLNDSLNGGAGTDRLDLPAGTVIPPATLTSLQATFEQIFIGGVLQNFPSILTIAPTAAITEGDTNTTLNIPVTLSAPQANSVTFTVNTSNGTAVAPADFVAITAQTFTIPAGQTTVNVPVTIVGDTFNEPTENFTVTISNPSANATLGAQVSSTVTITDNDPVTGIPVNITAGGSFTATAGVDTFLYNFEIVNGRARTPANGGAATITGFNPAQDILRFDGPNPLTEAQFLATPGVLVSGNPFGTPNTSIFFDPNANNLVGSVTVFGINDPTLSTLVVEVV